MTTNTPLDWTTREHLLAGNPAHTLTAPSNQRSAVLLEAMQLVNGDRNVQYGDPTEDFRRTAVYWSTHIGGVLRRKADAANLPLTDDLLAIIDGLLDPHDVAIMMQQLKMSRLAWDPHKRDTWADAAGYVACGWDCIYDA